MYAPEDAPRPAGLTQQEENRKPHLVSLPVGELRAHPSYTRHKLSVDPAKLSALADRRDFAFWDPIVVTHNGIVIDGYARWELAKRIGRQTMDCIEYEFSREEALGELIRTHRPECGMADFIRIELALDLELHFQGKALLNQQAGGQAKGLSNLTKAQRVDTRREVARLAGVSSGNVRKVKNILAYGCSSLLQAVRAKEVSINLADKWSHQPHAQQQEYLRRIRIERGIKKRARSVVLGSLARMSSARREREVIKFEDLFARLGDISSLEVEIVDAPGKTIFVTKELIRSLTSPQGVPIG